VLFGTSYWSGLIDWLKKVVLAAGAISPGDLELLSFTDDPEEAAEMATRPLSVKAQASRDHSTKTKKADV
jgi:predicted Rossmann-fold nucleotide-binding protein